MDVHTACEPTRPSLTGLVTVLEHMQSVITKEHQNGSKLYDISPFFGHGIPSRSGTPDAQYPPNDLQGLRRNHHYAKTGRRLHTFIPPGGLTIDLCTRRCEQIRQHLLKALSFALVYLGRRTKARKEVSRECARGSIIYSIAVTLIK